MTKLQEQLIVAFHNDTVFSLEGTNADSRSVFGGPIGVTFSGQAHGPRPLHLLARLSHQQLPMLGASDLPLIYGLSYSGCQITYTVESSSTVDILDLDPIKSSDDFPYPHYPTLLPYVPLRVSHTRQCPYATFAAEFPNMPEEQPADLVIAIPPPATLGVSLWGRWGDGENVTVVFECDLDAKAITAYNVCT